MKIVRGEQLIIRYPAVIEFYDNVVICRVCPQRRCRAFLTETKTITKTITESSVQQFSAIRGEFT